MQDADTIVPEFRSFMTFYRARSVEMQVLDNRPIIATIDGECAPVMELKAEVLPSALNVLLPRPACGSAAIRGLYECPMQAKAK
jgi:diacylglycerol kinase family enzyme